MKMKSIVYVVIRHTRSGDKRIDVLDSRDAALELAEAVVDRAVADYGYGSASVFKASLTLEGKALRPERVSPEITRTAPHE